MIVAMKKVYLFLDSKHKQNSLKKIRDMGILHPEEVLEQGEDFYNLKESIIQTQEALRLLSFDKKKEYRALSKPFDLDKNFEIVKNIIASNNALNQINSQLHELNTEKTNQKIFDDFDPSLLIDLNENEVYFHFYTTTNKTFKKLENVYKIGVLDKKVVFLEITLTKDSQLKESLGKKQTIDKIEIPKRSIFEIEEEIKSKEAERDNLSKTLEEYEEYYLEVQELENVLKANLEFTNLDTGINDDAEIAYFKGYVPVDKLEAFKNKADEAEIAYAITDPSEEDEVPTQIKNNRVVGLIKPVFDFLAIVPGYRERDISLFMLPFFTLFFAMIIGDAGYGAIFLTICLTSIFVKSIKKKEITQTLKLFTLLSFATLVWGAISNNWFASEVIGSIPFFKSLAIPALDSFNPLSVQFVQVFCFSLACVHMGIAHLWNLVNHLKSEHKLKALAEFGWIILMLGLANIVLNLVVDSKYKVLQTSLIMIGLGAVSVLVFSHQEGKFFDGILSGLKGAFITFFDFIGMFSDIISYIRLFAVGLASVEVATSFNAMAAEAPIYLGVFILLLGHTINVVLAGLSVIVHGVRLNTLEFSGHLGQEWSGFNYKPFKTYK